MADSSHHANGAARADATASPDAWGASISRDRLARLCAAARGRPCAARVAVVVAHPDDEVIGAGGRLPWLANVVVVHVTDGAPRDPRDARAAGCTSRDEYARLRRTESERALALAGIAPERVIGLGVADQEVTSDAANAARRLAALLGEIDAHVVLTHPYEGGHPDHDATALVVHAAAGWLARRGRHAPSVLELTSYHVRDGRMVTGAFPPDSAGEGERVALTGAERALKRRMFACHASQRAVLAAFPVGAERFRVAPRYDFTRAPRGGPLHYERYEWGMTGERFRALASHALRVLGADGAP